MSSEDVTIKAYTEPLPKQWGSATIPELTGNGVFSDGDWVESKDQDDSGDVRLIQLADIGAGSFKDKSDKHLTFGKAKELDCTFLQEGDVLIARMPDPLGRAAIFPGKEYPCVTVVDVCIVRPGPKANNRWLMHFINSPSVRRAINSLQSGTTRKRISRKNLAKIEIPVPPIGEQKRIVAKIEELFSKLDSGTETLNTTEQRLDLYQSSVIKSAVTGKLTETWRSENQPTVSGVELVERAREKEEKNKYKTQGKMHGLSEDHIFEVPRSWEWAQVGDICKAIRYGSSEKADYEFEGVPLLRMGNIQNGKLNYDDLKYLPAEWDREELMLTSGDVLFNRTNSAELVGKTALYKENHPRSTFASYLVRARVYSDIYNPALLVYFTNSVFGRQYISSVISQQVGQANVNATKFASMPIPIPPIEEQNEIVREIDHRLSIVDGVTNEVESNIKRSSRLRQSILQHSFEGNLVPQDPTEEPPTPDGRNTNLEQRAQSTLSEVTSDVE